MGAITDLHVSDGARVPGAAPGGADPTGVDEIGGVLAAAPPPRARSDRSVVRGSSLVPHGLTVVRAHRTGAPCPQNAPCRKAAEAGPDALAPSNLLNFQTGFQAYRASGLNEVMDRAKV